MTAYEQVTATPGPSAGTADTAKTEAAAVAGTAKDEAANVTQTASQAASEVTGTAKEQVAEVASEARTQISDLTSQARAQVAEQASTQKDKAASQARSFADQLQSMARGESTEGPTADIVRSLSTKVQELADKLERTEPQQLLDEVRRYARNKPGTFLFGAALAGFVTGRLAKGAISEDQTGRTSYGTGTTGAYDYDRGGDPTEVYPTGSYAGSTLGAETAGASSYGSQSYGSEPPGATDPLGAEPTGMGGARSSESFGSTSAGYSTESGVGSQFDADETYPNEPRRSSDTGGAI